MPFITAAGLRFGPAGNYPGFCDDPPLWKNQSQPGLVGAPKRVWNPDVWQYPASFLPRNAWDWSPSLAGGQRRSPESQSVGHRHRSLAVELNKFALGLTGECLPLRELRSSKGVEEAAH
jgi:hypothetical protein